MDNAEKYLIHCAGLYNMLAWLEEQQNQGMPCKISQQIEWDDTKIINGAPSKTSQQIISVHPLASRFFSLGIKKDKKHKKPFLAIQPNESQWFSMIQWERIVIRQRDMNIYFIAKTIKGDEQEYPDIPAFALALSVDTIEKLDLLCRMTNLDGREYWQEYDGTIRINFHNKLFSLPVSLIENGTPVIASDKHIVDFNELMSRKEGILQNIYNTANPPEFKGDVAQVTDKDANDLLTKLKKKWL